MTLGWHFVAALVASLCALIGIVELILAATGPRIGMDRHGYLPPWSGFMLHAASRKTSVNEGAVIRSGFSYISVGPSGPDVAFL